MKFRICRWKGLWLIGYGVLLFAASAMGLLPSGCTGKSIDIYSPSTGQRLATYRNNTDSEIGGLEIEYDPASNTFRMKLKSSTQAASESNAAMWAAVGKLVEKVPSPP